MGILDDTRDIRDDKRCIEVLYHSENGLESSEGIIGDLGLSLGHNGKERGLTCIRESDKSYVSYELELDIELFLFARYAYACELGSLSYGIGIVHVAEAALATSCNYDFLLIFGKVSNDLSCSKVLDDCSDRHCDTKILSASAVHLAVHALGSVGSYELMLEPEALKSRELGSGIEYDIAALTAVSAVRTAVSYELLCMEGNAAGAAVTCFNVDLGMIYKHLAPLLQIKAACRYYPTGMHDFNIL